MTRTELLPQIFRLSPPDQLLIAEAIRNHLVGELAPVSEEEFRAELDRRLDDLHANPSDQSPLDEVVQRLRAKLS